MLHQENVWLDTLQNKVFSSSNNGADAEEISEELDVRKIEIFILEKKSFLFLRLLNVLLKLIQKVVMIKSLKYLIVFKQQKFLYQQQIVK